MMRVKKDDTVVVLTGKDAGKSGQVIEILPKKGKIKVKGVAIIVKHAKARKQQDVSGIIKKESFIEMSNVMPVCSACKKPCRVGAKTLSDGNKVRVCKRCDEVV